MDGGDLEFGGALHYSEDVFLEPLDDSECFIVFLELLDEHEGGVAAVLSELVAGFEDFFSAVVDPDKVFLGDLNFRLDFLAMSSGIISDLFVLVGNGGKVTNCAC